MSRTTDRVIERQLLSIYVHSLPLDELSDYLENHKHTDIACDICSIVKWEIDNRMNGYSGEEEIL